MSRIRNDAAVLGRKETEGLFEKAIENDPDFTLAHAGRAFCEYWAQFEGQRSADFDLGFRHAERAIELDHREPFGHHALGALYFLTGNHDSSKAALQRAIELNPSFAWSYHILASHNTFLGNFDVAFELIQSAIRISPRDTLIGIFYASVSIINLCKHNYSDAVDWGRKAMAYPQPRWVHLYVLASLGHLDRMEEAGVVLTIISRLRPEFTMYYLERTFPLLQGEAKAQMFEGLRKAGLPER